MQSENKIKSGKLSIFLIAIIVTCLSIITGTAKAGPAVDRYIVVMNTDAGIPDQVAADIAVRTNGRIGYVFGKALQGFSITMPRASLSRLKADPRIAYVEEDIPVRAFLQTVPTGLERIFADESTLGIDGVDDLRVDADVAVLDTGIDREHPDLNVVGGANCLQTNGGGPPWSRTYFCDDTLSGDDDHYHGTHVAGTIGALDNGIGVVGVAPGVRLWAVKVLDSQGSGSLSGIIAGIDWVVSQGGIDVINMSLGGAGSSQAMDDAITNAYNSGVFVVVAAGNDDDNAANYTPASAPDAITVSALADFDGQAGGTGSATCRIDQDDTLADFSNWGSAVDIAAPGVCIYSTYPIENGEYNTISGTSMAAPHVAGAAALLASQGTNPGNIWSTLTSNGNFNWTDDSGDGAKEPLLDINTGFVPIFIANAGGGDVDTNSAPVANNDEVTTPHNTAVIIDVLANDTDPDGDSITLKSVTNGTYGSVSINAGGDTVTYTPNNGFTGEDNFTYINNDGTADSNEATVTVTVEAAPVAGEISLTATGYKIKGVQHADLSWNGATTNVDVIRDGNTISSDETNDGLYTDDINRRGGGSYTYKICETGSTVNCSNEAVIIF